MILQYELFELLYNCFQLILLGKDCISYGCGSSQDCLSPLSMQALPALPEALCIVEMGGSESREGSAGIPGTLYLNIGLQVRKKF